MVEYSVGLGIPIIYDVKVKVEVVPYSLVEARA